MSNSKLNVLIYPMFSVNNINADSNYVLIKQICNELVKEDKYNFILILDKLRPYTPDNLSKKIKIIYVPMPLSKKRGVTHWNTLIMQEIFNKYAIDMVWNNTVEQGHHFKYWHDTLDFSNRIKVFNYHHYVIHRSLENLTSYLPCKHILYDQVMGSLGADINFFHTDWCYKMMIEEATDILSNEKMKELESKCVINLGGYGSPIKSPKKYDIFTFVYNHRLDGYKNWKQTFEIFDRLWTDGYKFQVILTAGDKDKISTVEAKPYTQVKSFTKHEDYLVELSKCHANTINSRHETYCISIAESILNNQIVILPNRVTFPELVEKDYPYLFENMDEQYNMIKSIFDNGLMEYKHKEQDKLYIEKHAKFLDEQFQSLFKIKKSYFDGIKKQDNKEKIRQYLEHVDYVDLNEFKNFVFSLGYASQSFPLQKIKNILEEFGFYYNMMTHKYSK